MNERIQELFEQVADNLDPEDCMVSEEFLETFTELIVRECARLPFKDTGEVTTDGEIAISEFILKNFGVKE